MGSIDQLVSKLNIHGVNPAQVAGGNSTPELTTMDIYAALGFGDLKIDSYIIGLAVQAPTERGVEFAKVHCFHIVQEIFKTHGWSVTRPFQNHGFMMNSKDRKAKKEELGKELIFSLGALALIELSGPVEKDCFSCSGQGIAYAKKDQTKKEKCKSCDGTGWKKQKISQDYRSGMAGLGYQAWMKTWNKRYQICLSVISGKLNEFDDHVKSKSS